MRYCQPHWDALKDAIESRGLGHLISANGRDATARMRAELQGETDIADYDPLMAAHNMVVARATELGGLYIFTGDYCPVCEAIEGHEKTMTREEVERHYTDGPADAVLDFCKGRGIDKPLKSLGEDV